MLRTYRIEDNTIQYKTIEHYTSQYNTIEYHIIQYNTIQYNIIEYKTILFVYPTMYQGISPAESSQISQSSHHI